MTSGAKPGPINVIVVDDSALMRMIISDMLSSDSVIRVMDKASDGADAVSKVIALKPDVVTLDVEMPKMDGLEALKRIREEAPETKVVMLTGLTDPQVTLEALKRGAVDLVTKPSGPYSPNIDEIKDELITKVKTAATVDPTKLGRIPAKPTRRPAPILPRTSKVVAIGASTGGPPALEAVIPLLPPNVGVPILIVQHLPIGFTAPLAERLNAASQLRVIEASDGEPIIPGTVIIAKAGSHLEVERVQPSGGYRVRLSESDPIMGLRPCVDKMMESVAHVYGAKAIGVLLTGMGRDGTLGLKVIKERGGKTLVQDEASSVVFGMPKAAIESGCADSVVPLERIAQEIVALAGSS